MNGKSDKENRFLDITSQYQEVIAKVCWLYVSPGASFDDLYQEVLINIWQGMDSFRGEAKMSTWLYRTAINTCISWHRHNDRHSGRETMSLEEMVTDPADGQTSAQMLEDYRELYDLISRLGPLDKAIITLWLDEKSYDEMAVIMGMTSGNIAIRLHRIKDKLSKMAAS